MSSIRFLGSDGSRLATTSGSSFGWLIPDLHGDIAGASSASLGTITDALRYDAFGTIAASTTSALPTPWRYQGELLVNPAGASDLYANGARFYAPGLGVFTQLDTSQGTALNPLSLNRFLYAAADPETLIDPSGHRSCNLETIKTGCDGANGHEQCTCKKDAGKDHKHRDPSPPPSKPAQPVGCAVTGDCSVSSTPPPHAPPVGHPGAPCLSAVCVNHALNNGFDQRLLGCKVVPAAIGITFEFGGLVIEVADGLGEVVSVGAWTPGAAVFTVVGAGDIMEGVRIVNDACTPDGSGL
jgi:RHS repeat-associated protein